MGLVSKLSSLVYTWPSTYSGPERLLPVVVLVCEDMLICVLLTGGKDWKAYFCVGSVSGANCASDALIETGPAVVGAAEDSELDLSIVLEA